jgi:hypothetical protein
MLPSMEMRLLSRYSETTFELASGRHDLSVCHAFPDVVACSIAHTERILCRAPTNRSLMYTLLLSRISKTSNSMP